MDKICLDPKNDQLNIKNDKEILKLIGGETVFWTSKITKINRHGSAQERNFMITNEGIYNLKKKELKRKIIFNTVKGITVSKDSDEFIIHCIDQDHDYHFVSNQRNKILQVLELAFNNVITNVILPLVLISDKKLEKYVTTKDEKKKDINFTKMPGKNNMTITDYLETQGIKRVIDTPTMPSDYRKLKLVARGTFSKVFLAEFIDDQPSKKLFAMKRIRKDIICYNNLFDSVATEVKVLKKLSNPFILDLANFCQDEKYIYIILPFMFGGDLYQYLCPSSGNVLNYEQ